MNGEEGEREGGSRGGGGKRGNETKGQRYTCIMYARDWRRRPKVYGRRWTVDDVDRSSLEGKSAGSESEVDAEEKPAGESRVCAAGWSHILTLGLLR